MRCRARSGRRASATAAPSIRRPLTLTPFVEPRSRTIHDPPDGRTSACLRDTFASSSTSRSRASGRGPRPPLPSSSARPPWRSRASRFGCGCAAARLTGPRPSRPSCGPPRPGAARAAVSSGRTSRAWMPNSPSRSRSSVLNPISGRRQQRHPLAARVLEQVARQLARAARPRSPRTARGRRATARRCTRWARRCGTASDPVVLHLARQLARDLDRSHLGLEGARERALDEAGQLLLEAAEHVHAVPVFFPPGRIQSPSACAKCPPASAHRPPQPRTPATTRARDEAARPAKPSQVASPGGGRGEAGRRRRGGHDVERQAPAADEPASRRRRPPRGPAERRGGRLTTRSPMASPASESAPRTESPDGAPSTGPRWSARAASASARSSHQAPSAPSAARSSQRGARPASAGTLRRGRRGRAAAPRAAPTMRAALARARTGSAVRRRRAAPRSPGPRRRPRRRSGRSRRPARRSHHRRRRASRGAAAAPPPAPRRQRAGTEKSIPEPNAVSAGDDQCRAGRVGRTRQPPRRRSSAGRSSGWRAIGPRRRRRRSARPRARRPGRPACRARRGRCAARGRARRTAPAAGRGGARQRRRTGPTRRAVAVGGGAHGLTPASAS